ncbi:MAG: hypothetical protein EAZ61_08715 [Oscillatoriales cyanobacterium]|nr:MAG: hypothetical protein EAZ61_08715 [Oscillatoriales cyanobacterium]
MIFGALTLKQNKRILGRILKFLSQFRSIRTPPIMPGLSLDHAVEVWIVKIRNNETACGKGTDGDVRYLNGFSDVSSS